MEARNSQAQEPSALPSGSAFQNSQMTERRACAAPQITRSARRVARSSAL